MNINWIKNRKTLTAIAAIVLVSCSQERSPVTGWAYNDPTNGGFEKVPYEEQSSPICNSLGCPMVNEIFFNRLEKIIDASEKPILLYLYY